MTKEKLSSTPAQSFVTKQEGRGGQHETVPFAVKEKKEVRRPLKARDLKFIKAKVENPDIPNYKAAMMATGATSEKVGSVQSVRMLENVSLREAIDQSMKRLGFTTDMILKPVHDALNYDDEMATKRELTDMRLRGHDRAIKLMQIANPDESSGGNTFNLNFNGGNSTFVGKNN